LYQRLVAPYGGSRTAGDAGALSGASFTLGLIASHSPLQAPVSTARPPAGSLTP